MAVTVALCLAPIPFAKADSKTLTVPDDYPTISAAVANASDGDTILVRNGTYNEPSLLIDKSITLMGEDKNSTIIILHSTPYNQTFEHGPFGASITLTFWNDILDITAPYVTLSGLTIKCVNPQRQGKISLTGNGTHLINNKIDWSISGTGNRMQIINNSFTDSINLSGSNLTIAQNIVGEAIYCQGSYNVVVSNEVRKLNEAIFMDNDIYGPWLSISVGSFGIVVDNRVNAGGLALSGNGSLAAKNNVRSSVWVNGSAHTFCANNVTHGGLIVTGNNNTFYANNIAGYNRNTPYALSIGRNYDAASFRIRAENYANNTFYHNNFNGNTQLRLWDGVEGPNFWSHAQEGNYWSDYNGADANHDGIGDAAYVIDARDRDFLPLNNSGIQDLYPLMAPFDGSAVDIELPEWAPPLLSTLVSTSATPEPSSSEPAESIPSTYVALAAGALTAIIGLSIFYHRKRRG